jgi:uncharacterized protein
MTTATVLLLVEDLMFGPRLENNLRAAGYRPVFATDEVQLTRAMNQAPILAIVDLASMMVPWERLLTFIKDPGKKGAYLPVLGFGPHVDLDLRQRALAAGCTAVVGRSAISQNLASLVKKHAWKADRDKCRTAPPALVRRGLEEFNRAEYFECHESLELAWNDETEPVRLLYQGILQIAVACHHLNQQNWRGAMKVLEKGTPKLAHFEPECQGINVAKLLADARRLQDRLAELGPERVEEVGPELMPAVEYREDTP